MKYPLSDAQKKDAQLKSAADLFLRTGIDYFEREDYQPARVFLGMALNFYTKLGDEWNANSVTRPWYETACERVGVAP
jgi:hypothetical protein